VANIESNSIINYHQFNSTRFAQENHAHVFRASMTRDVCERLLDYSEAGCLDVPRKPTLTESLLDGDGITRALCLSICIPLYRFAKSEIVEHAWTELH
jgi:hypothetical protein